MRLEVGGAQITESVAEVLETMAHLRALQMMIRDFETIANPPGADDVGNDVPVIRL